ncbi:MAG: UPF0158 family protein [Methylococcales bacterium]
MEKSEFHIGQEFYTESGKWRCTDIGTRIIVAIHLNQEDSRNYNGPPYSIAEHVFDEYDIEGCSLDVAEFEDNTNEILKNKKLNEIHDALMFVSAAGYGENYALLNKQTDQIYFRSEMTGIDDLEELSAEECNSSIHIEIPHKNDLDLGRDLVFEFVEQFIPEDDNKVDQIFRKRGAYSRYKDLLESRGVLQKWYDFENQRELSALLDWCKENEIDITD